MLKVTEQVWKCGLNIGCQCQHPNLFITPCAYRILSRQLAQPIFWPLPSLERSVTLLTHSLHSGCSSPYWPFSLSCSSVGNSFPSYPESCPSGKRWSKPLGYVAFVTHMLYCPPGSSTPFLHVFAHCYLLGEGLQNHLLNICNVPPHSPLYLLLYGFLMAPL